MKRTRHVGLFFFAMMSLAGCRSRECPAGYQITGDRCAPTGSIDGGPDAGLDAGPCGAYPDEDGDSYGDRDRLSTSCPIPAGYVMRGGDCDDSDPQANPGRAESCNGADDDCDNRPDDTFDCVQSGTNVACTTACGSQGLGSCNDSCVATSCVPPTETCTYVDDDCDGSIDEPALQGFRDRGAYTTSSQPSRTWTFGGPAPVVFTVYRGGALVAQRFTVEGEPTGTEQVIYTVPAELEYANFALDIAAAGSSYIFLFPRDSRLYARRLDGTTLLQVGDELDVTNGDASVIAAAVAADADRVLFAYTTMSGELTMVPTDASLVPGTRTQPLGTVVGPIALAARSGSLDWWFAYSATPPGESQYEIHLVRVRPFGTTVNSPIRVTTTPENELTPTLALDDAGNVALMYLRRSGADWVPQIRWYAANGTPMGAADIADLTGICLYFTVPYCRPVSIVWSGSRWLTLTMTLAGGEQVVRLRSYATDGTLEAGGDGSLVLAASADQLRMMSGARLPSGVTLLTTPSPTESRYAHWGCF